MEHMPFELPLAIALLLLSASFSASETALFSLTSADERRVGPRALKLLERPRSLLVGILLGNLVVNTLFFAFAASLLRDLEPLERWIGNFVALTGVVVFGEVLPKTIALRARVGIARATSAPMSAFVALIKPVQKASDVLLEWIYRAIGPAGKEETGVSTDALAHALERSAEKGLLLQSEASFLTGIVELEEVRVRELMTPRVDMLFLDVSGEGREEIVARGVETKAPWVIVVDGTPDRILGRVRVRSLLTHGERRLAEMLEPCKFVPEVASAIHALHFLRDNHVAQAVVVDEWGGTAGLVTVENIFEEVVGDLRVEGEVPEKPVVRLGDGRFELDGAISIRDWNELFGVHVVPREFETLGGFVSALLGRVPRSGDVVHSNGLAFEVAEVRRRRILRIIVRVESTPEPGP
ncbi:MAG: HlyC/CorC family transporter [Planctomycetes bacterium]|nr:HlyC/CorC family transporter [Planctomycetota bacterium]